MNTLYRLFTENVNKEWICQCISRHFPGFTLLEGIGYWEGQGERSLCIEIVTEDADKVRIISHAIKEHNKQDSILVQKISIEGKLI